MHIAKGSRQILRVSLTSMERVSETGIISQEETHEKYPKIKCTFDQRPSVRLIRDLTIGFAFWSCSGHQFFIMGT